MWAWRSLLSRPNPLLSRLRRVCCHGNQLASILGTNNLIGPRGYACTSNGGLNAEENRQHLAGTKPYLYVVLDDHKDSYGIHKLDMDDNNDDMDMDGGHTTSQLRLPVLPTLSVALSTLGERAQFAAVGSRIIAIGGKPGNYDAWILMYDNRTEAMVVTPQVPEGISEGYEAAMDVRQRLYILESVSKMYWLMNSGYPGGELLCIGGLHCLAADPDVAGGDELWKWRPLHPSSQWSWSNNGCHLVLPFDADYIVAHAVHAPPGAPDHDIYISSAVLFEAAVTFSFSTASGEWAWRGN
ncbi:hypothetical protein ACQ4PT_029656 [Festuca glaucescens]